MSDIEQGENKGEKGEKGGEGEGNLCSKQYTLLELFVGTCLTLTRSFGWQLL